MDIHRFTSHALVAMLFSVPAVSAHAAVRYSVTDLTPISASASYAFGINDAGQVTGYISPSQTFLHSNGVTTLIDPPGGKTAFALNASGQLAGVTANSRAFVYTAGVTTELGTLGGAASEAHAINDGGTVAGQAQTSSGHWHAFVASGGVMSDLGVLPGGSNSWAWAINNAGLVTGVSDTTNGGGGFHAFVAAPGGGMIDLDTGFFSGRSSWGFAVNDAGQVAGFATTANNERHAFITHNNVMTDLGMLGLSSEARGINEAGEVVGFFDSGVSNNLGSDRAFVTVDGVMTDLNSLIAADSGWTLMQAFDINNSGRIVGWGRAPDGRHHAFLLSPVAVPLPASLWLFGSALFGWVSVRTRLRG